MLGLFIIFGKPQLKMSTNTITLTIPQYANQLKKKKGRIAVFNAVKQNKMHLLPGVVAITKVSRYFLLEVSKS
jgi:hypothetical protein